MPKDESLDPTRSLPLDVKVPQSESPSTSDHAPSEASRRQSQLLIVGIGASAGGLEALERFFDHVPTADNLAFVVIQHLSPDYKSLMVELLARRTQLPIHRVENGMQVEANSVYLIPPKAELRMKHGCLELSARDSTQGINLPIDVFFSSLAEDWGAQSVGIILSGSGSDGSRGVAAIHEAGGLVLVQHPETAKFESMPLAAIQSGAANFVLTPEQMPETLIRHTEQRYSAETRPATNLPMIARDGELAAIFALLLDRYGIDFTHYKPATVKRRIHRRIELSGATNLDAFVTRLYDDPEELNLLYKDLLIGVTQFFRDQEAFDSLQRNGLRELLKQKGPTEEFRVWDAGCATGEETYTLAILISELLAELPEPPLVKIFATDVHRDSLDTAGRGIYGQEAVSGVLPERLQRYFTRQGKSYRISQQLRNMVVFAPHNVVNDAPFTRIDLVVCRNLLIYLQPEMQHRVLAMFHYALNVGGVLLLGPSEDMGELNNEFETLDAHWKLYRKLRNVRLTAGMELPLAAPVDLPRDRTRNRSPDRHVGRPLMPAAPAPSPQLLRAYDAVLEETLPASILVNERYEVAHVFGEARNLLHPPSGRITSDVLMMVDGDLRVALSAGLQRANKEQRTVTYDAVRLGRWHLGDGGEETEPGDEEPATESQARLSVKPIRVRHLELPYFLITFDIHSVPMLREDGDEFDAAETSVNRIATLETELAYTRESLQATVEELQTSNEELQATNEELVASNEELQSTNEELHSVNEELHTVNSEYQQKITELKQLTSDMDNLLNSTNVGVIYLDLELCIRKFTPTVAEFFHLLPQDLGRPIGHISGRINITDLLDDVERVLAVGESCEHEIQGGTAPFLMRILPYQDQSGHTQGIVLAFIEISELKRAEAEVRATSKRFSDLFEAAPCGFIQTDDAGTIVMVNAATLGLFGYERDEVMGQHVEILVPKLVRDVHVHARTAYAQAPEPRPARKERQVVGMRKDGSEFPAEVGRTSLNTPHGQRILAWVIDITERKRLEDQKDRLLDVAFAASASQRESTPKPSNAPHDSALTTPSSARAFDEVLRPFVRQARLAVGTHQARISYLPDGDFSSGIHAHSVSAKYETYQPSDLSPATQALRSLSVKSKQPVCMTQEEVASHPIWDQVGTDELDGQGNYPPVRGWLAVPILYDDALLGILQLSDKFAGDFSNEDVETATKLAFLVAPTFALQYINEKVNTLVEERTEELARVNEALTRSNNELEQFAYIASHDLQEPLRKIVSYCQLLIEEQADRLDGDGQKYLNVAIDGAKRLQKLIRDLLAFSRITTHGRPLENTDAHASLQDAISNLEMTIKETRAEVTATPLPRVTADQGQLTVLFQNLIGNAMKYCQEPQPHVQISSRTVDGMCEFAVKDNGIGFNPIHCDTVFQIFQRLHNRHEYSGTGIGLAICKRIVERCGGEIWAESGPGAGSTFYFTLPTASE